MGPRYGIPRGGATRPAPTTRRRLLEIATRPARTALTPTGGFLASGGGPGFTHSLNPAVGCAFARGACGRFCYAREFADRLAGSGSFGQRVEVKEDLPQLLESELARAARRAGDHRHHVRRLRVFASSTTDPCVPPVLAPFREALRVLARHPVARIVIQTRSPRVLELEPEILALGERVVVSFSLETDDEALWKSGGAGAPGIGVRRQTFEALARWPVRRHLAVAPCLPIRDPEAFAAWIAAHATEATVDGLVSGDGARGRRSARGGVGPWLAQHGVPWNDEAPARRFLERLQGLMGARARWSAEGFAALAR